jgi:DNA polymerase III subunit beta
LVAKWLQAGIIIIDYSTKTMKFTINSSELTKSLEQAAKFVSAKPLMPILSNLKLVALNPLSITGFNLAHGIEINVIDCDIIDTGAVCIPVSSIAIIKGMVGQLIVEADDNNLITISNLSGKIEIQGQSIDEYPELESVDKIPSAIDSKLLTHVVKYCAQACSTDESKAVLTGINITAAGGNLRAIAADGHRLVVCNLPVSEICEVESVTIPAKSLSLVPTNGGRFIQCKFDSSQVSIDSGSRSIMRTLEGKYPDAMLLIPKSFSRELTIGRRELIDALNMMSAISDKNNLVKFEIADTQTKISASSDGKSGNVAIDCQATGDAIAIAFNLKYLIDGLKMFESKDVKFSTNEPLQPVIVKAVGSDLDLTYLVMPIQIRD